MIRSTYDVFEVLDNKGVYRLKGKDGWWNIQADNTFTTNGAHPQVSSLCILDYVNCINYKNYRITIV